MAILSNGYTQNCQPQDCQLVGNSEVGNLMLSRWSDGSEGWGWGDESTEESAHDREESVENNNICTEEAAFVKCHLNLDMKYTLNKYPMKASPPHNKV